MIIDDNPAVMAHAFDEVPFSLQVELLMEKQKEEHEKKQKLHVRKFFKNLCEPLSPEEDAEWDRIIASIADIQGTLNLLREKQAELRKESLSKPYEKLGKSGTPPTKKAA